MLLSSHSGGKFTIMEKNEMIVICSLSFFVTSTYCCLLSGRGGSCLTSGLSFGGRLTFPEGTPDYLSCNGENDDQKLIIFQRPRNFGNGKTIQSMFGHFGVGRIWISHPNTCSKPAGDANLQCALPEGQSIPCMDKTIPCHLNLNPDCDDHDDDDDNIPCHLPVSGGQCLTSGLSYGGQIYFPNGAPDYLSSDGEDDELKLIIFQRPRNFEKGKDSRSVFGQSGVGRIWVSDGNTCPYPSSDAALQCLTSENPLSSCMDATIPCNSDLNSDPRSDESPDITHRTLADKTPRNPIGYKVEYRIVGTATDWVTVEYSDLVERPLPGPLEEGYTYEYWISYKYGTQYDKRNKYGTHIEPCRDINLNLQLSTISQQSGMASVEADWSLREVTGPCSVANQTTSVKQIDNDNCPISEDSTPVTEDLRNHDRSHRRRKMRPNSEYNVSVTVFVGHQEFTAWKLIRTEETVPTSYPVDITAKGNKRSGQLDIRWKKPPCGTRNGRMKSYSVKTTRKGVTRVHNVKSRRARYAGFTVGEKFTVQVAAINSRGIGPYSPVVSGRFGT